MLKKEYVSPEFEIERVLINTSLLVTSTIPENEVEIAGDEFETNPDLEL
ncbi:MAG: hypothetical protein ACI4HN_02400 [Ruminococcus sp.]